MRALTQSMNFTDTVRANGRPAGRVCTAVCNPVKALILFSRVSPAALRFNIICSSDIASLHCNPVHTLAQATVSFSSAYSVAHGHFQIGP